MAWSDSSCVYIGFKIKLGDLIEQIQEEKIKEFIELFLDGFIEDENELFNSMYSNVYEELYCKYLLEDKKKNKNINVEEFKKKFLEESKRRGTELLLRYGGREETLELGSLYDQQFLYSFKYLL